MSLDFPMSKAQCRALCPAKCGALKANFRKPLSHASHLAIGKTRSTIYPQTPGLAFLPMPGFVFLLAMWWLLFVFFFCWTPAATRPRKSEMKKATRPNGPMAKKKDPLVQNRKADEIYLRLQKSAPFPTRKWLYVLCVSSLPNAAWPNRAYTDKQTLLWSEITPYYFKNQPETHRNLHSARVLFRRIL